MKNLSSSAMHRKSALFLVMICIASLTVGCKQNETSAGFMSESQAGTSQSETSGTQTTTSQSETSGTQTTTSQSETSGTQTTTFQNETSGTQTTTSQNETSGTQTTTSQTETTAPIHGEREFLELEDYSKHEVYVNFEEGNPPIMKNINLPHTVLKERYNRFYRNEPELDILVQYVKNTLNAEIDSKWKVIVHYYDADYTVGMVQFVYTVGEINTNRSIVFNIQDNKYSTVYHKCLQGEIDEADVTERVAAFKEKYIQSKRKLQDGETFCEEQTTFTYYIHSETLVYTYVYYFQYGGGVINNDWGTERIIDENGSAVIIYH